jgi:hypothetical protein
MEIISSSVEGATAKGAAEWFTGDVYIDSVGPRLLRPGYWRAWSTSCRAPARPGTVTPLDKASSSPRGSGWSSAAAARRGDPPWRSRLHPAR